MKFIVMVAFIVAAFFVYKVIVTRLERRRAFYKALYDQGRAIIKDHGTYLGAALHEDLWTDWDGDVDTSPWDMAVDKFTAQYLDPLIEDFLPDRIKMCKERQLVRDNFKIMVDEVARDNAPRNEFLNTPVSQKGAEVY